AVCGFRYRKIALKKKKNSTVIAKFKYYLAQRFSNSGISRTPKLPQIRPGRDPYLIRLFSRLPHLICEFYYKNCMKPITKSVINSVTYGWNYSQNILFFFVGTPWHPIKEKDP